MGRFTEDEIALAKSVDLVNIAENSGYSFKRTGKHYICKEDKAFVIFADTNTYWNYYEQKGGSVIDFVMEEKEMSFAPAVGFLLSYIGHVPELDAKKMEKMEPGRSAAYARVPAHVSYSDEPRPDDDRNSAGFAYQQTFSMGQTEVSAGKEKTDRHPAFPEENDTEKHVFAYLVKTRGIDRTVVASLIHDGRIYETKEHHNACFVATDKDGTWRHGFLRGTLPDRKFRGDVKGGDKSYGFQITGKNSHLVVFEAPIDLLSYMTLYHTSHHLLACGMLASQSVTRYLSDHPEISSVSVVFDADKPGRCAQRRLSKELSAVGYKVVTDPVSAAIYFSGKKDVNEYLVNIKQKKQEKVAGRSR